MSEKSNLNNLATEENWWRACVDDNMWRQYAESDSIYDDVVLVDEAKKQ